MMGVWRETYCSRGDGSGSPLSRKYAENPSVHVTSTGLPKSLSIVLGRGTPWGRGGNSPCAGSALNGHVMPHVPQPKYAYSPLASRQNATSWSIWLSCVPVDTVTPKSFVSCCHTDVGEQALRSCSAHVFLLNSSGDAFAFCWPDMSDHV